ncbi:hypothetical protein A5N15_01285 [Rothia kristinae]|uniref:Uncharacterized protein n=1 Tax=Rothia kristinae TaxID=37923 RepID=A0A657IW56_9MICC|nr:hypothetical protein A5N15_01285 [Rothia kristinae]
MSLMPTSRLTMDSERSPTVEAMTSSTASTAPCHQGSCSSRTAQRMPTATEPTMEPAKPSQVFFGLIRGAMGCLPHRTPAR